MAVTLTLLQSLGTLPVSRPFLSFPLHCQSILTFHLETASITVIHLSHLYILSQPRKEDIRTGAQRHRTKKRERIKSKIGKVKKLKVMLQKRLKAIKNKCCGLGHEM